ncbi:MAG TPA: glycosyltransferase, partial [Labilithrix sp.]|nr:glycosyltransferase [Labilithrix sp.]
MRKLTVLSVAYPFTKLSRDTSGGAEQVLAALDHAIVAAGHRSFVVAREGSRTAGTLASVRVPPGELDVSVVENVHGEVRATVARVLSEERIDVIHLHGIDFDRYLPAPGLPTIVTLHLPPSWYPRAALRPARPDTLLCCVSEAQRAGTSSGEGAA